MAGTLRSAASGGGPERLRARLRALAGDDPARARTEIARVLTEHLWRRCGPQWRQRGGRKRLLREQVGALAAESWLWVMGDRTWPALEESILGRVERRL